MNSPLFSVIIPTRDRPQFVHFCLYSLSRQLFTDFEVIVLDNPTDKPCEDEFIAYSSDSRFNYYRAENPMGLVDNWERGIKYAKGEYITYLEDKMMLRRDALQCIYNIILAEHPDMISWNTSSYEFYDETHDFPKGYLLSKPDKIGSYSTCDTIDIINRRMNMGTRNYGIKPGEEAEWLGKLLCGTFERSLCDKVRQVDKNLFAGYAPDYSTIIPSCYLSKKAIYTPNQLGIYLCSSSSNGNEARLSYEKILSYLKSHRNGLDMMKEEFGTNIIASLNKVIAIDYTNNRKRLINMYGAHAKHFIPQINIPNTLACIRCDMLDTRYPSGAIKQNELESFKSELKKLSNDEYRQYIRHYRELRTVRAWLIIITNRYGGKLGKWAILKKRSIFERFKSSPRRISHHNSPKDVI